MLYRYGRILVAGCIATAIAMCLSQPRVAARAADGRDDPGGYDIWADCGALPDDFQFLPIYLGNETPGFVDLNGSVALGGLSYRALQYTRDKDFGAVRATTGRWYGGIGAERWPVHSVDVGRQLAMFRVTAWEIDGTRYPVDPSCVLTFETDDLSLGLYNVWVRFSDAGSHTLKIFSRQLLPFFFTDPLTSTGGIDPFGLNGRRVFVQGEKVGDVLDQQFVHSYELQVGKEEGGGS